MIKHKFSDKLKKTNSSDHWFWASFSKNWWAYVQILISAAIINIIAVVTALFTMIVYDRVLPAGATESLFALTVGVFIALIFDLLLKLVRANFVDHAGKRSDVIIGERLFDHVVNMELFSKKGTAGDISVALREFETLRDFFTSATVIAIIDMPFIVVYLLAIYFLAGPLVVVAGVTVPLVLFLGLLTHPILSRLSEKILISGQNKQSIILETLSGLETIKALGAQGVMHQRWKQSLSSQANLAIKNRAISQGVINLVGFFQQLSQVLLVAYGAWLVVQGQITSGVLIAAVILTGRAMAPLSLITQTLTRINQVKISYRCLDALMQIPTELNRSENMVARGRFAGDIKFENVSFTYPGQSAKALDNVSFHIQPGEKVAILGPIGSGKSTIARLLSGLYQPHSGTIFVDSGDIRQFKSDEYRLNLGVALQEPWLVSGTLKDNIALGVDDLEDEDILRAAQISCVDNFAIKHPDGYGMKIAEFGQGLSGGQRQAVSLARCFIKNPSFFMLDEPTSSIDNQTERKIIDNIKNELKDRTLLLVTHKTSLLDLVDRVIVLSDGAVVFDGPKQNVFNND